MIFSNQPLTPEDQQSLDNLYEGIQRRTESFLGYPCNADFDYSPLFQFFSQPINNVGDPFGPTTYHIHSRNMEREVIDWFAQLLHAPKKDFWGYVTNGGTEGNLYGLYLARELMPQGIAYYSEDTHYSVSKNLRLLNMRHIMIKSQPNGEMDYEDLRETLKIHRDSPAIIFANIGTTMTEAVDRIDIIKKTCKDLAIHQHYIHCDAALAGMTLPFIENAPPFDFAAGADSISISGHKFIGSPMPCGIALAKKKNVDRIARSVEYIGALDTTITGSRNGLSPIFLWYAIKTIKHEGFKQRVDHCLDTAIYTLEQFREREITAWRQPHAITVVIPRPSEHIRRKWQLAVKEDIAHVICMPSVDRDKIDRFIEEYMQDRYARMTTEPEEEVSP